MDPRDRYIAYLQEMASHAAEIAKEMQGDAVELQKKIKIAELVERQGLPSYLPSPAMPAEEDK